MVYSKQVSTFDFPSAMHLLLLSATEAPTHVSLMTFQAGRLMACEISIVLINPHASESAPGPVSHTGFYS